MKKKVVSLLLVTTMVASLAAGYRIRETSQSI